MNAYRTKKWDGYHFKTELKIQIKKKNRSLARDFHKSDCK